VAGGAAACAAAWVEAWGVREPGDACASRVAHGVQAHSVAVNNSQRRILYVSWAEISHGVRNTGARQPAAR
jgi:hypothetical protein